MPKIKVLAKNVAELIAAGEVIERPASVVKELVENSIDAGATSITVELKNGGIKYIRVADNGCGISREDAPLAFLRHATSKVQEENDLDRIGTLGFRGEALASVCAVARVELLTKQAGDAFGTRVTVEGGEEPECEEAGCPDGTIIIVRDLFYNVPARYKFLKRDVSEANAVASILDKIALSHPEISFKFIRDNNTTMHTPGDGKLYSAIYAIFGADFAKATMEVDYAFDSIRVTGFTSTPVSARANRAMQHFFVNGRHIKSRTCSVALDEGYKHSIMHGKYPACVLNIQMPFDEVDVNVHPAKIEVRFINERRIFDAVYFAVKTALAAHAAAITSLQRQPDAGVGLFSETQGEQDVFSRPVTAVYSTAQEVPQRQVADPGVNYRIQSEEAERDVQISAEPVVEKEYRYIDFQKITSEPQAERNSPPVAAEEPEIKLGDIKIIGELFQTYILAEFGDEFIMIDKHAAHERILYEELKKQQQALERQLLISPLTLTLSQEECEALLQHKSVVEYFGFVVEEFGNSTVLVREIPAMLDQMDASQLISELALNICQQKNDVTPQSLENLLHSLACKAAIKAYDKNSLLELISLVERVYTDEAIRYCPHGRPVIQITTKAKVERQFGRQ